MDVDRFHALLRSLSEMPSRREVLRSLIGAGVGLGLLRPPVTTEAKKKGKKPKKRIRLRRRQAEVPGKNRTCCSGICQGKKPKKGKKDRSRCVAHNAGFCAADSDSCSVGTDVACNPGNPSCFCTLTTGNAGFCAAFRGGPAGTAGSVVRTPTARRSFGEGAACLLLGGACTPLCGLTGRTACAPPCV